MQSRTLSSTASGFSLVELLIAMTVTLVVLSAASTLLTGAFKVRTREDQRSEALADTQRALNIVSRELANSGFGLTDNGIVASATGTDAQGNSFVRFRANLNAYDRQATSNAVSDPNEDVAYSLYVDPATNRSYLIRNDVNSAATTVLANRVDSVKIHYYAGKVSYSTPDSTQLNACDIIPAAGASEVATYTAAKYLVLAVCVQLPAVGQAGQSGYQPASKMLLVSDVVLRNADASTY